MRIYYDIAYMVINLRVRIGTYPATEICMRRIVRIIRIAYVIREILILHKLIGLKIRRPSSSADCGLRMRIRHITV